MHQRNTRSTLHSNSTNIPDPLLVHGGVGVVKVLREEGIFGCLGRDVHHFVLLQDLLLHYGVLALIVVRLDGGEIVLVVEVVPGTGETFQ